MRSGNHKINIIMESQKKCPKEATLINVAKKTLEIEGIRQGVSVNLLFTDNKRLRELNKRFLRGDAPTDVIAFGVNPAPPMKSVGLGRRGWVKGFIGEIAISVEMAEYNAGRFHTSIEKEIFLYIIHGILHLLGYRDQTKREFKIIKERQNKILETLCAT